MYKQENAASVLSQLQEASGLKQAAVARQAEVPPSTYSKMLLHGPRDLNQLASILRVLGVTLSDYFAMVDSDSNQQRVCMNLEHVEDRLNETVKSLGTIQSVLNASAFQLADLIPEIKKIRNG